MNMLHEWRALLQAWMSSLPTHQQAHALVDLAAVMGDRQREVLRWLHARGARNVLKDNRPEAEQACAWLVPLTGRQTAERDLADSMDLAATSQSVTWLNSSMHTDVLAQAVYERTLAQLPDNYPILLRCFDPRVLPELHKVLETDETAGQQGYWSLDGEWRYLDRAMRLQVFPLPKPAPESMFVSPLSLSQSQSDALLTAAEVDQVMPELIKASPEAFLAMPPAQRVTFTREALIAADGYALASLADRVTFCVLRLEMGPCLTQHGQWAELMSRVKVGQLRLIEAIERATRQ